MMMLIAVLLSVLVFAMLYIEFTFRRVCGYTVWIEDRSVTVPRTSRLTYDNLASFRPLALWRNTCGLSTCTSLRAVDAYYHEGTLVNLALKAGNGGPLIVLTSLSHAVCLWYENDGRPFFLMVKESDPTYPNVWKAPVGYVKQDGTFCGPDFALLENSVGLKVSTSTASFLGDVYMTTNNDHLSLYVMKVSPDVLRACKDPIINIMAFTDKEDFVKDDAKMRLLVSACHENKIFC